MVRNADKGIYAKIIIKTFSVALFIIFNIETSLNDNNRGNR